MHILDLQKKDERVIIVGDIHGCYATFIKLLDKCGYIEDSDILISVGDLINKGPNSKEVVDYFYLRQNKKVYVVMGNNEERYINHKKNLYNLSENQMNYLKNLPRIIRFKKFFERINSGMDLIVVHAGLVPGISIEEQKNKDVTYMRNVQRDRITKKFIGDRKTTSGVAWIDEWKGPEFVVFGHDARRNLQHTEYALGLDTGCVYGRELTAVIFKNGNSYKIVHQKKLI